MQRIGIGVLCYFGLDELQEALDGIDEHTRLPHKTAVWDNSEDWRIGEWLTTERPDVAYLREPHNIGCAAARNRLVEWFAARGMAHAVILDQDVRPAAPAWAADMLAVFSGHPDTAVVGWHLATRQMGPGYEPDSSGAVPELPGMCNMYSIAALNAGDGEGQRGWCEEYFAFRFDSDLCYLLADGGWRTRIVWPDTDKVRHDSGHKGVTRNPRMERVKDESRTLFARRVKARGWPRRLL